jgi:hypothetical protein
MDATDTSLNSLGDIRPKTTSASSYLQAALSAKLPLRSEEAR